MVIGNKYYISGWAANNFNMQNSRAAIWEGTVKTAKLLKPGKDPKLKEASGWHMLLQVLEWDTINQPIKFGCWKNRLDKCWYWPNIWKVTPGGGNIVYDLLREPDGSKARM